MVNRNTHLIGSLPFDNEMEAMEIAIHYLGKNLPLLPDGEVGEKTDIYKKGKREGWIMTAIQSMADSGAFEILKDIERVPETGLPRDYFSGYLLKPKYPPGKLAEHMNFGYDKYFKSSYEIFRDIRTKSKLYNMKFQVGIPTGYAIALPSLGMLNAVRYRKDFDETIAKEVNRIFDFAGGEVVFQVEVVIETQLALNLPRFLKFIPSNIVKSFVKLLPEDAAYGIHFCVGDLNSKSFTHIDKTILSNIIEFVNNVVDKWPQQTHSLEFVHVPLAAGEEPPKVNRNFYWPLMNLRIPGETRFIAGCIHEGLSLEDNSRVISYVDEVTERIVDIASTCGLGRRDREVAEKLLKRTAELSGAWKESFKIAV